MVTSLARRVDRAAVLISAMALDRWAGEVPSSVHPVVGMGWTIDRLRRGAPRTPPLPAFAHGLAMALAVPAAWGLGAAAVDRAAEVLPWPARWSVRASLLKSTFASRALEAAAEEVLTALRADDVPRARRGLRSLCSRDPSGLDAGQLAAATIESLAENASDSIVAPLLAFVVAGMGGAFAYRAINTLDAMVGYHGEYEWLGKASARSDDLCNLVPARLTAALLLLAGAWHGDDVGRAIRVGFRDAGRTESPNAGWPMATMAGLLDVQLDKPGHYRLGDGRVPDADDIVAALARVRTVTSLWTGLCLAMVLVR